MGVGGQHHAPAALPPGITRYRRLGRPRGRSGRVLKISPLPGFDPRTVQLQASRYTDWAIAAQLQVLINISVLSVLYKEAVSCSRYISPVINMESLWNDIDRGKTKYLEETTVTVPLRIPQIPQSLAWNWNRASAVIGRRLTAWNKH
jgi:hypothetical protein